jgi:poly-gamma-glutamate capsule biosynthesis protein CapA/YwtB (metallophosphatase superfamily)
MAAQYNWFLQGCMFLFILSCANKSAWESEKNLKPAACHGREPTIKIAFVGDIILHQRLRQREEKTKEGFSTIWQELQPLFDTADILYGNLEGPVAHELGGVSGYPRFNFPESILPELKKSGFDVVSTANNHSLDRGFKGIDLTIRKLRRYELLFTGTTSSDTPADPFYTLVPIEKFIQKKQRYVAFIACTEMLNGHLDKKQQVLLCYEKENFIRQLVADLSQRADVKAVIVTPHWGEENIFIASERQKKWARSLIGSGAKAVVGSHSHVIGEIEKYKNGIILYSLGNFVSNQPAPENKLSKVFYIHLDQQGALLETRALPIFMHRQLQKDGTAMFRLRPVWDWSVPGVELKNKWQKLTPLSMRIENEQQLETFMTDRRQSPADHSANQSLCPEE